MKHTGGIVMCRVITPDSMGHEHLDDPLAIAELLRETLAEELHSMNDVVARWHMVEEEEVKHALYHVIEHKQNAIKLLWSSLEKMEGQIVTGETKGHSHGHSHHH